MLSGLVAGTAAMSGCGSDDNAVLTAAERMAICEATPVVEESGDCVTTTREFCMTGDTRVFESVTKCREFIGLEPLPVGPEACEGYKPMELAEGEGTCAAFFTGYQVDAFGICTEYSHSGCEMNPSLFESKEACQTACETAIPVPTDPTEPVTPVEPLLPVIPDDKACAVYAPKPLPEGVVTCQAIQTGYQIDAFGTCVEVSHTGCSLDEALFASREACQSVCETPIPIPTQPVGPLKPSGCFIPEPKTEGNTCKAVFTGWQASASGECTQYTYSGCAP